jgi:hypothetical protein
MTPINNIHRRLLKFGIVSDVVDLPETFMARDVSAPSQYMQTLNGLGLVTPIERTGGHDPVMVWGLTDRHREYVAYVEGMS